MPAARSSNSGEDGALRDSFNGPASLLGHKLEPASCSESKMLRQNNSQCASDFKDDAVTEATPVALVLDGVSAKWQRNVLQVLATPTSIRVAVDGHGHVDPIAFRVTPTQARHLAKQITELLGLEY
jgi:hypothetical protein